MRVVGLRGPRVRRMLGLYVDGDQLPPFPPMDVTSEDALLGFDPDVGVVLTSKRQLEQVVHGNEMGSGRNRSVTAGFVK